MVLVNTDYISGKELEMLGMVKGSTIQCKNIGRDIGASFKNLVGGEMKAYTEMMNEARDLAIQYGRRSRRTWCRRSGKYSFCDISYHPGSGRSHCIRYGCQIRK